MNMGAFYSSQMLDDGREWPKPVAKTFQQNELILYTMSIL
jgi:hypothetical protein